MHVARLTLHLFLLIVFTLIEAGNTNAEDRRQYQHGVEFLKQPGGGYWLLWSSAPGDPPNGASKVILKGGSKCEYFTHDIYYSAIDVDNPRITKKPLIVLPEAQEPVSAAMSSQGNILVTYEDGSESDVSEECIGAIQQRYQLFSGALEPRSSVNTVSVRGGHSGHVAAAGDLFTIAYAEGWIEGDGFDNAGTANDIHVEVVNSRGQPAHHRALAVDSGNPRDWWPLIAASPRVALLVWQRFVPGSRYAKLMFTVYDPQSNKLTSEISLLKSNVLYYHYDVQYLQAINRFLVTGTYFGNFLVKTTNGEIMADTAKGFAYLLDESGHVIDQWDARESCNACKTYYTYTFVREAQPAIYNDKATVKVLYPVKPSGWLLLNVTADNIGVSKYIAGGHYWFPLGTDGVFFNEHVAFFANLTPDGIKTFGVNLD